MYTTNSKTCAEVDIDFTHYNIFRALRIGLVAFVGVSRLDYDCIIVVSNVESLNERILTSDVHSIRVKREAWQSDLKVPWKETSATEQPVELQLALTVHLDLKIMEIESIEVFNMHVEVRRVFEFDSRDL